MKVYQKAQQEIAELTNGVEMAGYLAGLKVAATVHCIVRHPEEIWKTDNGTTEISEIGFGKYLNSDVVEIRRIDNAAKPGRWNKNVSHWEADIQGDEDDRRLIELCKQKLNESKS